MRAGSPWLSATNADTIGYTFLILAANQQPRQRETRHLACENAAEEPIDSHDRPP